MVTITSHFCKITTKCTWPWLLSRPLQDSVNVMMNASHLSSFCPTEFISHLLFLSVPMTKDFSFLLFSPPLSFLLPDLEQKGSLLGSLQSLSPSAPPSHVHFWRQPNRLRKKIFVVVAWFKKQNKTNRNQKTNASWRLLTAWYSVCSLFSSCWCLVPATQPRVTVKREQEYILSLLKTGSQMCVFFFFFQIKYQAWASRTSWPGRLSSFCSQVLEFLSSKQTRRAVHFH